MKKKMIVAGVMTTVAMLTPSAFGQGLISPSMTSPTVGMTEPVNVMSDVFTAGGLTDMTDISSGLLGSSKELTDDETMNTAIETAQGVDTDVLSEAMETVLLTSGVVDEDVAVKASSATGSMTNAAIQGISSKEMMTMMSAAPMCATALATVATTVPQVGMGAAAAPATGGASMAPALATTAATATASLPGLLGCGQMVGAGIKMSGTMIEAYESDPDAPQMVELVAEMEPDSQLGQMVLEQVPEEQREQAEEALWLASGIMGELAKIKFGETVSTYGTAIEGMSSGNIMAGTAVLPVTMKMAGQMVTAMGNTVDMDTSMFTDLAGADISDTLVNAGIPDSNVKNPYGTVSEKEVSGVTKVNSDGDVDEDKSSNSYGSSSTSSKSSKDKDDVDEDASSTSSKSSSKSSSKDKDDDDTSSSSSTSDDDDETTTRRAPSGGNG